VTYVGYIEVLLTATTTPSMADLPGTEFALEGERVFPPESRSMSLAAGPEPFCPGWTLFYTFRLTNTQAVTLTNLTATNDLPVNTCCAANEPGSQAMGSYNEATNRMTWSLGPLPPGQTLELRWSLHSFTSLVSGSTLTNTLVCSATELTEPGTLAVGLTADDSICAVTPTPTSTPTPITPTPTVTIYPSPSPTPTLTPTSRGPLYLPLVFNMGGNN